MRSGERELGRYPFHCSDVEVWCRCLVVAVVVHDRSSDKILCYFVRWTHKCDRPHVHSERQCSDDVSSLRIHEGAWLLLFNSVGYSFCTSSCCCIEIRSSLCFGCPRFHYIPQT